MHFTCELLPSLYLESFWFCLFKVLILGMFYKHLQNVVHRLRDTNSFGWFGTVYRELHNSLDAQ